MMKLGARPSSLFVLLSLVGCLLEAPTVSELILNDAGVVFDLASDGSIAEVRPRDVDLIRDTGSSDHSDQPDAGVDGNQGDTGRADSGAADNGVDAGPQDVGTPAGYVLIIAGRFIMGSPATESDRVDDEGPQHQVTITRSFFMKTTEITRVEWFAVMGFLPHPQPDCSAANCPVTALDRDMLIVYVNNLSLREGVPECYLGVPANWTFVGTACLGYRLPTEAEWEYAARAGTTTRHPFVIGSGQILDDIAWFGGNSMDTMGNQLIHPVAALQPNGWGLYDIIGNATEVVHSRLTADYFGAVFIDPEESGAAPLAFWGTRGCDYTSSESNCRVAVRGGHAIGRPGTRIHGGRPVRTAP